MTYEGIVGIALAIFYGLAKFRGDIFRAWWISEQQAGQKGFYFLTIVMWHFKPAHVLYTCKTDSAYLRVAWYS